MSANNVRDCPKCKTARSVREDYEIYSEDDIVYVEYSTSCYKCDFKFKFTDERDLMDKES